MTIGPYGWIQPKPYWQCGGCGAQFHHDEVKIVFQCSLTHRSPYRGSGYFIDCPACGKFEGVRDLVPPPPPDPNWKGPKLRPVSLTLYDSEQIKPIKLPPCFVHYGKSKKNAK